MVNLPLEYSHKQVIWQIFIDIGNLAGSNFQEISRLKKCPEIGFGLPRYFWCVA